MVDDIALDNFGAHKLFLALGSERSPERDDVFFVSMPKDRFYRLHGDALRAIQDLIGNGNNDA